jgi:hypothetical protein
MKFFLATASVLVLAVVQASGVGAVSRKIIEEMRSEISPLPVGELTSNEKEGLLQLAGQEKFARDALLSLTKKRKKMLLGKIAQRHKEHLEALGLLFLRYEIASPLAESLPGDFQNPDEEERFITTLRQGSADGAAALSTAMELEEILVHDYREVVAATDNPDFQIIFERCLKRIYQHMHWLANQMAQTKLEYKPKILSPEDFAAIVQ